MPHGVGDSSAGSWFVVNYLFHEREGGLVLIRTGVVLIMKTINGGRDTRHIIVEILGRCGEYGNIILYVFLVIENIIIGFVDLVHFIPRVEIFSLLPLHLWK